MTENGEEPVQNEEHMEQTIDEVLSQTRLYDKDGNAVHVGEAIGPTRNDDYEIDEDWNPAIQDESVTPIIEDMGVATGELYTEEANDAE